MIQSRGSSGEGWKAWRSADRTNRGIQKNFSEVGESSFTLDYTKALMESAEVPGAPTISRWNCKNTSAYANFAFARHFNKLACRIRVLKKFELSTRNSGIVFLPIANF